MESFIKYLEEKIEGCELTKAPYRDKIIYQLVLDEYKKQLSIHGVVQPNLTYKHPIEGVNEFTQTETELEDMPDCPNCGSDAVGFDGINGFYECFQCDDNWIA